MKKKYLIAIGTIAVAALFILTILFSKRSTSSETVSKLSLLKEAKAAESADRLKEAKALYQDALEKASDSTVINTIRQSIETINMKIIFSPGLDNCSIYYKVEPKDNLSKIAKKFGTTVNLIKRSNSLSSDTIQLKQEIKVYHCKFSLLIDKSQNLLFLKQNSEIVKTYIVSTGKDNSTPVGKFVIDNNKLQNPTWFKTGAIIAPGSPDNILGSRWMGLAGKDAQGESIKGYGIHGTTEPDQLGKQITLGCIRMSNKDVEELFDIIPTGTEVIIID